MVGSGLNWREKTFLALMAPRGIVAAATTSVFAIRLEELGYEEAGVLVPIVFLVIVGTVAIYGLGAGPAARLLGLAGGPPQGVLLVGAHRWARQLAEAVQKAGFDVLLLDSNRAHVKAARLAGLPAHHGNALAEELPEYLPLESLGRLLAITPNDEVNSLAALHFAENWETRNVYQLVPPEERDLEETAVASTLRGRFLFGAGLTYDALTARFRKGAVIKSTKLSEEFTYQRFRERYGEEAVLLFVVDGSRLVVSIAREKLDPKPGQTVIALVEEPEDRE
jgi:hypothetical protein